MGNLMDRVRTAAPAKGEIALFWIGQAGFLIKNSYGETLVIDLYLSDYAERMDGNKRLTAPVVEAEDLKVDFALVSHCHTDHLDLLSLPAIIGNGAQLFCCKASALLCEKAGLDMNKVRSMQVGDIAWAGHITIEAAFCDHGDYAPEALAFIIETDGIVVYFVGDTGYQMSRLAYAAERDVDVMLTPINGEYGNLNERDAALLAALVKPGLTVPCHFWTLGRQRGNPYDFELAMKAIAPDCKEYTMCHGEGIYYSRQNGVRSIKAECGV